MIVFVGRQGFRYYTKSFSPEDKVVFKKDDLKIKVTYGRPAKRDRRIFGGLVPYGEIWRTGANEATEISFTKDVLVADHLIKAGKYTLFTIPEKNSWTVILNSEPDQWGIFSYDPKKDVARVDVPVQKMKKVVEFFTIDFSDRNTSVNLQLKWDRTKVGIPLKPAS